MTEPASPVRNSAEWAMLLARCSPSGQLQAEFRDRICSIDSDLTDTEKEGEMLNRKLNKRLSGNPADLNSEFFLDKITKWQSNKKVEKLKGLLSEHLPKVKSLEEDIQASANSVAIDKETATSQANCLVTLIEQQIEYYQQHMNFLDDVINDIRQCDYTIVREIADIKMAFTFSMELDVRQRANSRNSMPHNPCSVLMKVGVDSTGHAPSKRILDDNMLIPNIQAATVREKPALVVNTSLNSKGESEPDVSISALPSSLRKEHLLPLIPQRPSSTETFPEPEEIHVISASSNGRISPSLVKNATGLSNSVFKDALLNSMNLNANGSTTKSDDSMKGDGTDYKRKCLKSSSINIQSLNLTRRDTNGGEESSKGSSGSNGAGTPPDGKKRSSKGEKDKLLTSPRSFMRAVSNKLSEITQFGSKDDKEKDKGRAGGLKCRSLSVPNGLSDSGGTVTPPTIKQPRPSSAGGKSASTAVAAAVEDKDGKSESTKVMHRRSTSMSGSSYFFPAAVGAKSPESATQATAVATSHATTPRPQTLNAHTAERSQDKAFSPPGYTSGPSSGPPSASITPPSGSRSPELHLGIAEMRADEEEAFVLDAVVRGTSQTLNDGADAAAMGGGLSTSSSCSNMSQASTVITNPADSSTSAPSTARGNGDGAINKRKKYAALLFHYPNLQPCLSDPALKVVARKLNKCLKFKDELQRSLVKAETVQETETSCLRKLRKVQRELEDLTQHCAHPAVTSTDTNSVARTSERRSQLSQLSHGYRSACSSGSYSYNGTVEGLQSTSGSSQDVMKLGVVDFDADLRRISSGEKMSLQEHDLSSTDDEHEHHSNSSSQSHEHNGFALHSTLFEPPHGRLSSCSSPPRIASFHPSGGALAPPCPYSTEEDPTIIDASHDAVVSQMSAEILDCASRCAQHLKVLLEEEQEVTDKLTRVRHLLSSAHHIDEQLAEKFSK